MSEYEIVEKEPHPILFMRRQSKSNPAEISQAMGECYGRIIAAMQQHGIEPAGPPMAIYIDVSTDSMTFDCAIPLATAPDVTFDDPDIQSGQSPGGKALHVLHQGSYTKLGDVYMGLYAHAAAQNLQAGHGWEYYLNDPSVVAEDDLLTDVYVSLM